MKLSLAEARALAITAQSLAGPREAKADRRAVRALVEKLGVVQIDSVNVLVRSHYLPAFSRLGAYDRAHLDTLAHRAPRALFEYWGHEASLLPIALQPLFRWRMERAAHHAWRHVRKVAHEQPDFVKRVLDIVRDKGPIAASELDLGARSKKGWWEWSDAKSAPNQIDSAARKAKGWWAWSDVKSAVEWLFWSGQVTSAARRGFERLYDLPERVLPRAVIDAPTPTELEAHEALVERSARAMGVATETDLRDYYRLPLAGARAAVKALVDQGILEPVTVEGWKKPAYRHRAAKPAAVDRDRGALLSPFDSLIWARERTERLFAMKFKLEIYTPEHKRIHGYYVLPFLLGEHLVARVDLKADRKASTLRVIATHAEAHAAKPKAARALAEELSRMARWLELEHVVIERRGDLAQLVKRALA